MQSQFCGQNDVIHLQFKWQAKHVQLDIYCRQWLPRGEMLRAEI